MATNEEVKNAERLLEIEKERKKVAGESKEETQRRLDLEKQIDEGNIKRLGQDAQFLLNHGQINKALEAAEEFMKKRNELNEKALSHGKNLSMLQKELATLSGEEAVKKQKEIDQLREKKDILDGQREIMDAQAETMQKILNTTEKLSKEDTRISEELGKSFSAMTMGLIDVDGGTTHVISKTTKLFKQWTEAEKPGLALSRALGSVFNLSNIAASAFDTVAAATKELFFKLDQAAASFSAATGLGRQYIGVLNDVQRSENRLGISADEASKATQGLLANFSSFTKISEQSQKNLVKNVAALEKFGVSSDESAKLMHIFNKVMGQTTQESIELTKKIGMMGTKIGISTKKMLADYTAALSVLAVYGEKSLEVFTGIAAAAKTAGVETGTLLSLAEKFDTFAGAAETTGKLNALLGSQLSATEMLNMTEDKRLKTLVSTVQATGQSFASMDRFTQKAIANAAGITDMAEANKIFGMSLSEYERHEDQMKRNTNVQKNFEDALQSMMPVMEKLSAISREFAANFAPVLDVVVGVLGELLDVISWLNKATNNWFGTIVGGVAALTLITRTLKFFTGGLFNNIFASKLSTTSKAAETTALEVQTAAQIKHNAAQSTANTLAKAKIANVGKMGAGLIKLIPIILAFGAAILMAGAGIGLAAVGMAQLVKSFENIDVTKMMLMGPALILMGVGFSAFAAGLSAAAPMLLLGAGSLVVFFALLDKMNEMDTTKLENLGRLFGGLGDFAINISVGKTKAVQKILDQLANANISAELENLALITTGTSSNVLTQNAVTNVTSIGNIADKIEAVFKPEINISMDAKAVEKLMKDGVYSVHKENI